MSEPKADFTDKAVELMRKADAGDAKAQHTFATYLLKEEDFSYRKDLAPDEIKRGMNYLKKAAAQGYFQGLAAIDLGDIYYRGEILPKAYKQAKLWYNTAMLKNNPAAAYMLGECAYYGYDEDVSYEKAVALYIQAAPRFIDAVLRLGNLYARSEYLPYDPEFAKTIYEFVLDEEEKLYKKHNFYSDAYNKVIRNLEELKRDKRSRQSESIEETEGQANARKTLLEIIRKKRDRTSG